MIKTHKIIIISSIAKKNEKMNPQKYISNTLKIFTCLPLFFLINNEVNIIKLIIKIGVTGSNLNKPVHFQDRFPGYPPLSPTQTSNV